MITKENAKEFLPLVQALAEGKAIQYYAHGVWSDTGRVDNAYVAYRVKPGPEIFYRVYVGIGSDRVWLSNFNSLKDAETYAGYAPGRHVKKFVVVPMEE